MARPRNCKPIFIIRRDLLWNWGSYMHSCVHLLILSFSLTLSRSTHLHLLSNFETTSFRCLLLILRMWSILMCVESFSPIGFKSCGCLLCLRDTSELSACLFLFTFLLLNYYYMQIISLHHLIFNFTFSFSLTFIS